MRDVVRVEVDADEAGMRIVRSLKAELQALTTAQVKALTTYQIANLSAAQFALLETRDVAVLSANQAPNLSTDAIVALASSVQLGVLPASLAANLSAAGDLREAAANLFALLRALDRPEVSRIAVMPVPETGLGLAINDRLRRAAADDGGKSRG